MSSPSTPAAPDYVGAAEATSQGNLEALQYQTEANRVNQVGPEGSQTWSSTPDSSEYNDAMQAWVQSGEQGAAPQQSAYQDWTETDTLNPTEQSTLNAQEQTQLGQTQLGQNLFNQANSTMSQGFNAPSYESYMENVPGVQSGYTGFNGAGTGSVNTNQMNTGSYVNGVPSVNYNAPQFDQSTANAGAQAAYNAQMGMIQPEMQEQQQSTQNQLALQGLTPGTQAYDNAMRDLNTSQSQQIDQIANQSDVTGNQLATNDYQAALAGYQAGNQAQSQAYGEGLSNYGANLSGLEEANQAQGQQYGQALQDYDTSQEALSNQNQAQAQAFDQGQQGYEGAYSAAQNNYYQPLEAMDAVTNGTGVSNLSFPSYFQEGYAGGTDYTGATENQAAWDQGIYNTQAAQSSDETNAGIGLAGTAAMAAAIYF